MKNLLTKTNYEKLLYFNANLVPNINFKKQYYTI